MKANYTALLLAAGYGSRIADVTTGPKSLLKINDQTLMDHHFNSFKVCGIKKIVIVTGYEREILEDYIKTKYGNEFEISFALNEDYRIKGNTYSLFYGLEKIESDFLLFDADLIYDPKILLDFLESSVADQILVGESSIDDIECAKAMVDNNGFVRLTIDKRAVTEEERMTYKFAGEAIGILKFSNEYKNDLLNSCTSFLKDEKNISKNWEHVMNEFLLTHNMSAHSTVSSKWVEIDNREDYQRAKKLFL